MPKFHSTSTSGTPRPEFRVTEEKSPHSILRGHLRDIFPHFEEDYRTHAVNPFSGEHFLTGENVQILYMPGFRELARVVIATITDGGKRLARITADMYGVPELQEPAYSCWCIDVPTCENLRLKSPKIYGQLLSIPKAIDCPATRRYFSELSMNWNSFPARRQEIVQTWHNFVNDNLAEALCRNAEEAIKAKVKAIRKQTNEGTQTRMSYE